MTLPQVLPHDFGLYPFSDDTLYEALSNEFLPASEIRVKRRAIYLAKYLARLGARLIIVEPAYIDAGYLDDYAAYYVKCFKTYDRRCKRIHFFSKQISADDFLGIVDGKASKLELGRFTNSYLGFVVARPLPDAIIGRTVLKTYDPDNGRRNYKCIREYTANLFGIDLRIKSLAFQEQDTVMAACATVALWCAFNKTRDLFNSPAPTPAEITRTANRLVFQSRSIPSHGLNVQQMTNVIQHVGLEPEVVRVDNTTPFVSLVYAHLKWGLPVILAVEVEGIGKHAITLVGYSEREERVREHEVAKHQDVEMCPPMVGLRIDRLFAHDDRLGPFVRLDIEMRRPTKRNPLPVVLRPKLPTDANHTEETGGASKPAKTAKRNGPPAIYPITVIVPVYHKIRVTFQDVEKLLLKFTEVLRLMEPKRSIEWDLHLTTTNEYKSLIKVDGAIPKSVKRRVLLEPKPKYFWRAVLTFEGQKALELLADATDMSRSFPIFFAIWHNQEDKSTLHDYLDLNDFKDATKRALGTSFWQFLREWSA
jgi:hypothetical protein